MLQKMTASPQQQETLYDRLEELEFPLMVIDSSGGIYSISTREQAHQWVMLKDPRTRLFNE